MAGVQRTKLASPEMQAQVRALEAEGKADLDDGHEIDGMTLTPLLMIQRDATGKSIMLKDKNAYLQHTDREEDVSVFVEVLRMDPLSKAYCRILFQDGDADTGAVAHLIPGYTEEQLDAVKEVPATLNDLPTGTASVVKERLRQITDEDWSEAHDQQYTQGELLAAAMNYLEAARLEAITGKPYEGPPPLGETVPWPWDPKWWKPAGTKRNVEKAGALVCAEADRADFRARIASAGSLPDVIGGLLGQLLGGAIVLGVIQLGGPDDEATG